MPAPYARLGRVTKPYGPSGELVIATGRPVQPASVAGTTVWVVPPLESGAVPRTVLSSRTGHGGLVIRLEGITTREEAQHLAGRWLLARATDLPESLPDAQDWTGYAVHDAERGPIGTVRDIIVTGANDVLVVEDGPFGQVLVPVIDDVVRSVDDIGRAIDVRLLPGLIDEDAT
jgi:16S rRNA processing protein RimM